MAVIFTMCLFSLAMSITPGPVNFITLSTGVNHGFRKTLPFVTGATLGFTLLLGAVGAGLGSLISDQAQTMTLFNFCGTAFICYMGYQIMMAEGHAAQSDEPPATFFKGFLLQWINPKAWTACLAGITAFNLVAVDYELLKFVSLYFVICFLAISSWAFAGAKARSLFQDTENLKLLNRIMGGGLILLAFYLQFSPLNN